MRYFFLCFVFLISSGVCSQELTGAQLLEKAIDYHDPNNNWTSFKGKLNITMNTPDEKKRVSEITMNLPKSFFEVTAIKDGVTITQTVNKGECTILLNGNSDISEEDKKTHRLTCQRANMYKDYYTYLYGLPMKLKNQGTQIASKTEKRIFKGKEYLVLKVTYEKEVGDDTWYFYFDPKTYRMEVYQFFHDESENDGEYILLTEEITVSGMKIPKTRAWYYNKDNKYLGTDVLTKASEF